MRLTHGDLSQNNMKILHFTLEGILQSWGERSSWDVRDTAEWPTKSGIAGMLGAAMGIPYNDPEVGRLCESIQIGFKTKAEREPLLTDFQTANYMGGPLADGRKENRDSQKMIAQHKKYIPDRKFLVAITSDEETIEKIRKAMLDPVWAMHLGRTCCIPSRPIIPHVVEEFDSLEDALKKIPLYEGREIMQIESSTGERRMDVRRACHGKKYTGRYVKTKAV